MLPVAVLIELAPQHLGLREETKGDYACTLGKVLPNRPWTGHSIEHEIEVG